MGAFELTAGEIGVDTGIKTSTDARFYSISAPLASEISNKGKDLIVSFTVRHDQVLDCGGAYIKLLAPGVDQAKFSGDDKYAIMFGPDMCGTSTRKTHVILTYNGKNLLTKKNGQSGAPARRGRGARRGAAHASKPQSALSCCSSAFGAAARIECARLPRLRAHPPSPLCLPSAPARSAHGERPAVARVHAHPQVGQHVRGADRHGQG
jgi:hypothetical protein